VTPAQRYRSIDDLPPQIPVFPLRGCILLPRTLLPLNIFEPRYLAMLEDAIRGSRMIGMVQPVGDGGGTGSPLDRAAPLRSGGCAGRVTAFQELDDGRLTITLSGIARFILAGEEPTETAYRVFSVDYSSYPGDLERGHGEDEVDRDKVLDTLRRYLASRGLAADWSAIRKSSSEQLINSLAVASPFGCEEKQALLEARDLRQRAETLMTLAEMEIAGGGSDAGSTVQ
jgi:Lon protease-like protein